MGPRSHKVRGAAGTGTQPAAASPASPPREVSMRPAWLRTPPRCRHLVSPLTLALTLGICGHPGQGPGLAPGSLGRARLGAGALPPDLPITLPECSALSPQEEAAPRDSPPLLIPAPPHTLLSLQARRFSANRAASHRLLGRAARPSAPGTLRATRPQTSHTPPTLPGKNSQPPGTVVGRRRLRDVRAAWMGNTGGQCGEESGAGGEGQMQWSQRSGPWRRRGPVIPQNPPEKGWSSTLQPCVQPARPTDTAPPLQPSVPDPPPK